MTAKYTPQEIEPKWQARWEADGLHRSMVDPSKPKHYALTMLPYPSGDLHIGHWYPMTPSDARARWMRMRGYNVLFPMGFDAFGLPAENAAIKRKIHPKTWTYANIERMRRQLRSMGAIFDWEREAVSCDPEYYRWSQWFFLQFYKNGLAYRQMSAVDFCPNCNTTLAREQVWGEDRHCERCGTPVIKKDLEQWFFRTTKYADELNDHSQINWPEKVKAMQVNWVGKSEGAHVTFRTEGGEPITVFTTRPDTLWGATFMVLAPEHPLVATITRADQKAIVDAYIAETTRRTEIERTATDKDKTGVFTGGFAINPVNQERIPIWISDYVLLGYGTGAIMAVPAHDQRDFEFARKFGLKVRVVIQPAGGSLDGDTMTEAYPDEGVMVNSGRFDDTPTADGHAVHEVVRWLEAQGMGKGAINYRLRDWLISRQRYWGTPIPIVYCKDCGTVPVPDEQLPVVLPEDVEFMPTGESPLRFHEGFLHTTCPQCGGPALRETDTMDTFMCSSWYQLRYLSPKYEKAPFDPTEGAYWLPVDQYTGGIEHATMHLMYTRFFTKAMRDCGIYQDAARIRTERGWGDTAIDVEPMIALYNQGMILGEASDGSFIVAEGDREVEKLNAQHIRLLTDEEVSALKSANGHTADAQGNTVKGEIVKRVETLLNVEMADGTQTTVEVLDTTQITDHAGNTLTINDLRYRLGVEKMSKSKGNVVAPDVWVARYGADTMRGYLMFAYRWELGGPWDSQGIQGVVRWLNDVWALVLDDPRVAGEIREADVRALRRKVHQTIQRVSDGLESFSFNTAVAALMELKNTMQAAKKTPVVNDPAWRDSVETMLVLMAPFTPHITEELWERIGNPFSIHQQPWPAFDADIAKEEEITLVVQVNGKVRARIQAPADISEADARALATSNAEVAKHFNGGQPKQVIYVKGRGLVNIVL
jgi:leucyl-tRNA synthetase